MIRLTRLRNRNPLYLNPDHIERLDSNHETTVHLSNGNEYVVTESADEVVRLVHEHRAQMLVLAARMELETPRIGASTDPRFGHDLSADHDVDRAFEPRIDAVPVDPDTEV